MNKIICPICQHENRNSTSTLHYSTSTKMHIQINYNEDGSLMEKPLKNKVIEHYICSNHHLFEVTI